VSPKIADPAVRTALIESAAHLITQHGPNGLTIRGLAAAVGTSTMAVYTHFGSMDELLRAVSREGFARLAQFQASVRPTSDPVADVTANGIAYYLNAIVNPDLYRVMFMGGAIDPEDAGECLATFETLGRAVRRCIDAGRFAPADEWSLAVQLWAMMHGMVTLQLAGMLTPEETRRDMPAAALNFFIGFGDDRTAAARSLERGSRRMARVKSYSLMRPELVDFSAHARVAPN
jgi:AcrR family transcriptional regulator